MEARVVLLTIALLLQAPLSLFANGGTFYTSVIERTGNLVPMAKPLISLEVIINLIGATSTRTGLDVYAQLDRRRYPNKIQVTDAQLATVNIHRSEFRPAWNYTSKHRSS